jgi:hypothetical protein
MLMYISKKTLIACLVLLTVFTSAQSKAPTCHPNTMKVLGIKGAIMEKGREPTPGEKSFCRRNRWTCCTEQNIESVNEVFSFGVQAFRKKMEIAEELFSLFKGKKFMELIETIKDENKCLDIVKDLNVEIKGKKYDFFSTIYQNIRQDQAANILLDIETYLKKIIWFHGDLVCSICNPTLQPYFHFREGNSSLLAHISTCFEIMEERDFELEIINMYDHYISKVTEFVKCGTDTGEDDSNESEVQKLEDDVTDPTKIVPLNMDIINEFRENHHKCVADKGLELPECQKFCSKDLRVYSFPVPNFFRNLQVSLKILFEQLSGISIEEYYNDIKEEEFLLGEFDEPINFFAMNKRVDAFKVTDTQWNYSATDGSNMYREIMSKRFLNAVFESAKSLLVSSLAVVTILFL